MPLIAQPPRLLNKNIVRTLWLSISLLCFILQQDQKCQLEIWAIHQQLMGWQIVIKSKTLTIAKIIAVPRMHKTINMQWWKSTSVPMLNFIVARRLGGHPKSTCEKRCPILIERALNWIEDNLVEWYIKRIAILSLPRVHTFLCSVSSLERFAWP